MTDFERARAVMVDNQIRTSGVTERRVLGRMAAVPRELFVAPDRRAVAYIDDVQWLGDVGARRFIAAPATFAKLLQLAEITQADAVLDIGAASGYSTAVIAGLCASVLGLEREPALAAAAQTNIAELGITNARIVAGDIAAVGAERFDVVIVQGALDDVPDAFFAALRDGGRLIALVRSSGVAVANVFVKTGKAIAARGEFNATMPLLHAGRPAEDFVF